MTRCIWCGKRLWFWQIGSPGGAMHARCYEYTEHITAIQDETQKQYEQNQARLRWEQEDRL